MKNFKQRYKINASKRKVWNALVNPKIIDRWGGGPKSKMRDELGFRFSLWKGTIFGKNIQVEKNKLLVQEWYAGRWDEPSIVTFDLEETEGLTILKLTHDKVPDKEEEKLKTGWKKSFMSPLIELVENS
jgi:activator of HSP90 ATPase